MTTTTDPSFIKLNAGWNAKPDAPHPKVTVTGTDILLEFFLNPFRFPGFDTDDRGIIRFSGVRAIVSGRPMMKAGIVANVVTVRLRPLGGSSTR